MRLPLIRPAGPPARPVPCFAWGLTPGRRRPVFSTRPRRRRPRRTPPSSCWRARRCPAAMRGRHRRCTSKRGTRCRQPAQRRCQATARTRRTPSSRASTWTQWCTKRRGIRWRSDWSLDSSTHLAQAHCLLQGDSRTCPCAAAPARRGAATARHGLPRAARRRATASHKHSINPLNSSDGLVMSAPRAATLCWLSCGHLATGCDVRRQSERTPPTMHSESSSTASHGHAWNRIADGPLSSAAASTPRLPCCRHLVVAQVAQGDLSLEP